MTGNALRIFRITLWGLVLITGLAASWYFLLGAGSGPTPGRPAQLQLDLGRGEYRLVTTEGKPFTQASLEGEPSLVFFGFTHCPDVCPTTLGDIAGWKEELGPSGAALRVFFVSVDPERDTEEMLRSYIEWLPGAVGVTGSVEETAKALKAFRIYARKSQLEGDEYSMDHSAYVMLFDRDGAFDQVFGYQEDRARVVAKLRLMLEDQT